MTTPAGQGELFPAKAEQSWLGAQSELAAERFENAIALAYYACFQLGVANMASQSIPEDRRSGYSHGLAIESIARTLDDADKPELSAAIRGLYAERLTAQYRGLMHARGLTEAIVANASAIMDELRLRLEVTNATETYDGNGDANN